MATTALANLTPAHAANPAASGIRTVTTTSPVSFGLTRDGGAVIHGRLDIWSGLGGPAPRREEVLFFEDSLDALETFTRKLQPGVYGCILKVFIVEDLNGTFDWTHLAGGQPTVTAAGDVNVSAASGEAQKFRDEYLLRVV